MTAEVAVMNKIAIALAADSAVTIETTDGLKAYHTANKVFTLSKFAPVGLLVFNNPEINSVSLEVISKEFRQRLGSERFSTLEHYVTRFIDFLKDGPLITDESKEKNFYYLVQLAVHTIFSHAIKMKSEDEEGRDLVFHIRASAQALKAIVDEHERHDSFSHVDVADVINDRRSDLDELFTSIVNLLRDEHEIPELPHDLIAFVVEAALLRIFSALRLPNHTGIVVAGYGDDEYFPSYIQFELDGFTPYGLRCSRLDRSMISDSNTAQLGAFAQSEMAEVFMEGMDNRNLRFISSSIADILGRVPDLVATRLGVDLSQNAHTLKKVRDELGKMLEDFHRGFERFRHEKFSEPVIEAIAYLDKSDLASMAESIVAITSLKRKVSLGVETVGGPIDVAIISKHDGFMDKAQVLLRHSAK